MTEKDDGRDALARLIADNIRTLTPDEQLARVIQARRLHENPTLDALQARHLRVRAQGHDTLEIERQINDILQNGFGPLTMLEVQKLRDGTRPVSVRVEAVRRRGHPPGPRKTVLTKRGRVEPDHIYEAMLSRLSNPLNPSRKEMTAVLTWATVVFGRPREALRKGFHNFRVKNSYL